MLVAVEIPRTNPTPPDALRIHGQYRFPVYKSVATGPEQFGFGERADYDVVYVRGKE